MIRKTGKDDILVVAEMALLLWEGHTLENLRDEISGLLNNADAQIFLAYASDLPIGFAQCQLRRDYVEGTHGSPVGYLEGIFVKKEYRKQGHARELLSACELWAREQGCTEFASDCELTNTDSFQFHKSMGFVEANRIICFVKKL